MSLETGARLGPYEILSVLGVGGMGEVYRARDTKLKREVAIKVLSEAFAQDPDRLARFEREAELLAALNHPCIAHIYGLDRQEAREGQEGTAQPASAFIAMELVEGEDLAQRIARGAIPLDETLPIARQIAEALEAAHEKGVIHRDLKPANIKVRADGTVKVLDFGLAKALEPASGSGLLASADLTMSPTITSPALLTGVGMILGTAAYMSPEQARGKAVDKRADIWAFGCVVYEVLTGLRAFPGDDLTDTLAAVVRAEPNWDALPTDTPSSLRRLLIRCLKKDPRGRMRDIGEARIVLDDPAAAGREDVGGPPLLAPTLPLWRRVAPLVLASIAAGALVGAAAWYLKPLAPLAVTRLAFPLPEGQVFTGLTRHLIAISADGAQMVYAATPSSRLYLRSLSEFQGVAIRGTEGQSPTEPAFSPDGRSIVFYARQEQALKKIAVTGGTAVPICPADQPFGVSWGPDGIVFGQGSKGIMRVSQNGGTPEVIARVNDGEEASDPELLPGGQQLLFTLATGTALDRWDRAQVVVQSVTSGERKTIVRGGSAARYLPTGHLAYVVGGNVSAVAFDVQRLQVSGDPVQVIEGVRRSAGSVTGAANFSVSSAGSLIFVPGLPSISSGLMEIALFDRAGATEPLPFPPGRYLAPRVSPDGTRITFGTDDGKEAIVWIDDLSGTTARRRLTYGGNNRFPIWSADGTHIAFQSDRENDLSIFWQPVDGGAAERLTTPNQGESHVPESWSRQADLLLFSAKKGSDESLATLSVKDRKVTPFGGIHSSTPTGAIFSPDGQWVAYASTQGTTTIYVQPFPATGATFQLIARATDVPHAVAWSPDGQELFYDPRAGGFESVRVTTRPTFAFGNPVAIPQKFQMGPQSVRRTYDITPRGKFVGLMPAGQSESAVPNTQIQVVLNWFEELKRLVPVN